MNVFQPALNPEGKEQVGGQVSKRHHTACISCQRVLECARMVR